MSAADLLDGYYDQLARQIDLPEAPAGRSLAADTAITRFAFGSCLQQNREQGILNTIAARRPQMFMMIGDNVYGDTNWAGDAELGTLRAAYTTLAAAPEFAALRGQVPMLATWDDHDYGLNDAGGEFAFSGWAERLFESFWGASSEVRERPGIYESHIYGPQGRRVQVILLDTRSFRSPLVRAPVSPGERPPLGPYAADTTAEADMLGAEQWAWLARELRKPADLRLVVSSIQVLTDAHSFEAWKTMPGQRGKLYGMLAGRNGGGVLLLSGDRHAGGIYRDAPAAFNGQPLWEITSSSLNLPFTDTATNTAREPDPKRVTDFISEENFGEVAIDWRRRELRLALHGKAGEVRATQTMRWDASR
jgi:alkaline phosphatase D